MEQGDLLSIAHFTGQKRAIGGSVLDLELLIWYLAAREVSLPGRAELACLVWRWLLPIVETLEACCRHLVSKRKSVT